MNNQSLLGHATKSIRKFLIRSRKRPKALFNNLFFKWLFEKRAFVLSVSVEITKQECFSVLFLSLGNGAFKNKKREKEIIFIKKEKWKSREIARLQHNTIPRIAKSVLQKD